MVAFGESLVSIAKFDLGVMVRLIEEFSVTHLAVAPPVVVALLDENNERWLIVLIGSLESVASGGAPITVAVINKFRKRFPNVSFVQVSCITILACNLD